MVLGSETQLRISCPLLCVSSLRPGVWLWAVYFTAPGVPPHFTCLFPRDRYPGASNSHSHKHAPGNCSLPPDEIGAGPRSCQTSVQDQAHSSAEESATSFLADTVPTLTIPDLPLYESVVRQSESHKEGSGQNPATAHTRAHRRVGAARACEGLSCRGPPTLAEH